MKKNKIKQIRHSAITAVCYCLLATVLSSCNDWLDVLPNNEQVTDKYWKSKEDVEAVITSGYYYMRQAVPTVIKWGEYRGGTFYTTASSEAKLQDFDILPNNALCNWSTIYRVIGMANSVIQYAPNVKDNTYYDQNRNSNLAEAYFMRAWCHLLLAKNFKEAPLVTKAFVNDKVSFDMPKATEAELLQQVKDDVKAALATGAAKGTYEEEWQTKGRVTKWALYALMADACVWSEDWDQAIEYADMILNATDNFRPAFIKDGTKWFKEIFFEGNSNESIFELNWNNAEYQETNNFAANFGWDISQTTPAMRITSRACLEMKNETQECLANNNIVGDPDHHIGRMLLSTYIPGSNISTWLGANEYYLWKYRGGEEYVISDDNKRIARDANFIIYRVAEVMMLKAQALVMKGEGSWKEAVAIINQLRNRAGLTNFNGIDTNDSAADVLVNQLDELTLLNEILAQKDMEFVAEGKRWYDLLWFGRIAGERYKTQFIEKVIEGNQTTKPEWIRSAMQNEYSWYMPIPQADIESNKLLKQNPYYTSTK